MYIQDCVVQFKISSSNRINLPKALEIAPDTHFMLFLNDGSLYLAASLTTGEFIKKYPKTQLLCKIRQDGYGRIVIPARFRSIYMSGAKEFWLKADNDAMQISYSL